MKHCQICQQPLFSKIDWRYIIKNENHLSFCNNCLNDDTLIQNYHHEYITLNYYHHRHFLSAVLKQRYPLEKAIVLTVGYQKNTPNLYDETYAICELITPHCFSLTPTKLPNKKLRTNTDDFKYKKPLYVISYNGLPKSIEQMLKNITYQHITLM